MSGAPGAAWAGIIAVGNNTHLFDRMPPPGGYTSTNPAAVYNSAGRAVEVVYAKGGKKKIRKVSNPLQEVRKISKEEAMTSVDKMYKYLLQFNKQKDAKWEAAELAKYKDSDEE